MSVEESVIYAQTPCETQRTRIRRLIEDTAAEYGVTYEDIMSKSLHRGGEFKARGLWKRTRPVVLARHDAMTRVRDTITVAGGLPISYPSLGRIFGRDHATVMSGISAHRVRVVSGEIDRAKALVRCNVPVSADNGGHLSTGA